MQHILGSTHPSKNEYGLGKKCNLVEVREINESKTFLKDKFEKSRYIKKKKTKYKKKGNLLLDLT